jgi:hypothetical protein
MCADLLEWGDVPAKMTRRPEAACLASDAFGRISPQGSWAAEFVITAN